MRAIDKTVIICYNDNNFKRQVWRRFYRMKQSVYKISFSVLVLISLALTLLPICASAEQAVWDGTTAEAFASGDGTEQSPYAIMTPSELSHLAKLVNGGETFEGQFFMLGADIYLNAVDEEGKAQNDNTWAPIGSASATTVFGGTFDGAGHTVYGLYTSSSRDSRGLFGRISQSGAVKNLCISSSDINGKNDVGAIAAINDGVIYNCASISSVSKASSAVGGICGLNNGEISYCSFNGEISATNTAGGICGVNNGTIYRCEASGAISSSNIAGGICGTSAGTVTESTNKSTVSGSVDSFGGICAEALAGSVTERCINLGSVSGSGATAGICGDSVSATVNDCYNAGAITAVNYYVGGIVGRSNGSTVAHCYSTGTVLGAKYAGAICGRTRNDTFTECYYLTGAAIDARDTVQNGFGCETRGKTTPDVENAVMGYDRETLLTVTVYAGFDRAIWDINDGMMPALKANVPTENEAHFHTIETVTVPVACESDGYTTHSCTVCGIGYTEDVIPATGHSIIHHDAKDPTVDEVGWDAYDECDNCDYTTYAEIPKLPPDPIDDPSDEPSREPVSDEPSQEPSDEPSAESSEPSGEPSNDQTSDTSSEQPTEQGGGLDTTAVIIIAAAVVLLAAVAGVIIILRDRKYRNWR